MSDEPVIDPFKRKQCWRFRGKGPGGRNLCHCGCGREVQPPRRTAFSDKCVDDWKAHNCPITIGRILLERDRGVCALCRLDTEALRSRVVGGADRTDRDLAFWIADQFGYQNQYVADKFHRWECREDVAAAVAIAEYMAEREVYLPWRAFQEEQRHELAVMGFTDSSRRWWEADHIVPVIEGGGGCGPEGYRTLCLPCHRRETAKLAARLAARRRAEKEASVPTLQLT